TRVRSWRHCTRVPPAGQRPASGGCNTGRGALTFPSLPGLPTFRALCGALSLSSKMSDPQGNPPVPADQSPDARPETPEQAPAPAPQEGTGKQAQHVDPFDMTSASYSPVPLDHPAPTNPTMPGAPADRDPT